MKTVKKFILSLLVVCFLSSNAYAWVENYSSSVGFLDKVATAVNFRSPLDTYSRVNSKWNQPRDEGSNPHKGVDLRASVGTPIYAVYDGWVEHINVTGNADIRFRVDVNGNQVKDSPDYYVRFYHCNSRLAEGYYSKGAQIGTSGNQGGVPAHQASVHSNGQGMKSTTAGSQVQPGIVANSWIPIRRFVFLQMLPQLQPISVLPAQILFLRKS